MKKNRTTFKIRVNEKSLIENLIFFKDFLISSNIMNADFSNLSIFYFEKDSFFEEIFCQNLFPPSIYFQISKDNFKTIIKNHNKKFLKSKTKLSFIILPKKITKNDKNLISFQKKIIKKVKSLYKFIITNVPENKYIQKFPSWTQNVNNGLFFINKI